MQTYSAYSANQIKGIDDQFDQTIGVGYAIFDSEKLKLSIVPGIGAQHKNHPAIEDEISYNTNFYQDLEWQIHENIRWTENFRAFYPPENSAGYNFIFETAIRTNIFESYLMKAGYELDYDNSVSANIKKYTSVINLSVGYEF